MAVLKRRPREHPGRRWLDDHLGKRIQAHAGLDVQTHRESRGRRASVRLVDREPNRAQRRRLPPGSGLRRVRARDRDREARVGVSMQPAGEKWAGTERRRRRRRKGVRAHPDRGLCAECEHRPDDLGRQRSPAPRSGHLRHPATGGQRAGLSGKPIRLGARRRGAAGAQRVKRSGALEVQYGRRPRAGREVAWPRRRRRVGDAAGRWRRVGDVRDRQPVSDRRCGDRASGGGSSTPTAT